MKKDRQLRIKPSLGCQLRSYSIDEERYARRDVFKAYEKVGRGEGGREEG